MVDYSIFPLDEEIKDKLAKLEISYAFQPSNYVSIFNYLPNYARQAPVLKRSRFLKNFYKF